MAKLLLLLSVIALLSVTTITSARPCQNLFISSYTFSIRPVNPNPNPNIKDLGFLTIVAEITQQQQQRSVFIDPRIFRAVDDGDSGSRQIIHHRQEEEEEEKVSGGDGGSLLPFGLGLSSYDINSLRDRTKDILSVVVALLFGVGCGALTAATMYLVWSLFATRYDYHYGEFDGEDEEKEDDVDDIRKRFGYVKIPDADSLPKQVKEAV